MKALLKVEHSLYNDLIDHLLPQESGQEQAAFLFAKRTRSNHEVLFEVIESVKLGASDLAEQETDYLEMADETRARLIKRAHDLEASLVEMHSHPGPWPAAFSLADRNGLKETVPHMWWRLQKRPYVAIVVANSGFDALVWLDNPRTPQPLNGLLVGDHLLRPTNSSLQGWT